MNLSYRVRTVIEAQARYGVIEHGVWKDESKHCVLIEVPEKLAAKMINSGTGLPTLHIYCNRDMAPALQDVFADIVEQGLEDCIHSFDGCFMIRCVRGEDGQMSTHCYALAIDLNASTNQLGETPTMDPRIVAIFEKHGFKWGGTFRRLDGMHFSRAWE